MAWQVPTISIEAYGNNEAYLDAVADSILQADYRPKSDYLLLSLHAIPLPDIDAGDTYTEQVRRSSHAIAERLGAPSDAWSIAYQSPFGDGRRWTGPLRRALSPDSPKTIAGASRWYVRALRSTASKPSTTSTGFFAQRTEARRSTADQPQINPTNDLLYVPCLNASKTHAEVLAEIVLRADSKETLISKYP